MVPGVAPGEQTVDRQVTAAIVRGRERQVAIARRDRGEVQGRTAVDDQAVFSDQGVDRLNPGRKRHRIATTKIDHDIVECTRQ